MQLIETKYFKSSENFNHLRPKTGHALNIHEGIFVMSVRLIFILLIAGLGVAGCRPGQMSHTSDAYLDGASPAVAAQTSTGYDPQNLAPVYDNSDQAGTAEENEIIRRAMSAHHDQDIAASAINENAIIDQAMTAQASYQEEHIAAPVHRVRHVPDVAMQQIRQHQPYLLDSGDRVRVFIYGQPNLSRTYYVDGSGFISVPLIGSVRARNQTTDALKRSISDLLEADYLKEPQVSVEISQHRPFFILGEVRRAGQYPFVNAMTAQTAVAIAGGFSERAYEKSVKLTRVINGYRTNVEVAPHEPVYPGDTIHVRERFF